MPTGFPGFWRAPSVRKRDSDREEICWPGYGYWCAKWRGKEIMYRLLFLTIFALKIARKLNFGTLEKFKPLMMYSMFILIKKIEANGDEHK